MIGSAPSQAQQYLYLPRSLESYIPAQHPLRLLHAVLDLSWVRDRVAEFYCLDNGRPSIPPETVMRLYLAGAVYGITADRELIREAQVNLAIRWFIGLGLDDELPDHSSLTRIRQRWGADLFEELFATTVALCARYGLVGGRTIHIDATLIRADASWESLTTEHVKLVFAQDGVEPPVEQGPAADDPQAAQGAGKRSKKADRPKRRSHSDPDATLATSRAGKPPEPSYKQHTAVDDTSGVVVGLEVTTGEVSEGSMLTEQIRHVELTTGTAVEMVTADSGYASGANYEALEAEGIEAVIPPQRRGRRGRGVPLERFRYDPAHQLVRCPEKKLLRPAKVEPKGVWYRAQACDCADCPLRARCVPRSARSRSVLIVEGYDALLRARRARRQWSDDYKRAYRRHRWQVEGAHGEAKTRHGLRRAARRRLWNVKIQVYLTGAVMNLKRAAKAFWEGLTPLGAGAAAQPALSAPSAGFQSPVGVCSGGHRRAYRLLQAVTGGS